MLSKERLTQLAEMEAILNESQTLFEEAEQFLEKWLAFLPKMKQLESYYFDGDWREDASAYEQGEIPPDMPCGVLSEDLAFNASVTQQSLAIRYLKIVTTILEQGNT